MKITNHTTFNVQALPFNGPDGKAFVTLIVKGTYSILAPNSVMIADNQLPIAYGDEPYNDDGAGSLKFEADIAPYKPRADIVLVGHAYAPTGHAVSAIDVSLRVGAVHRVLRIFGDRQWHSASLLPDYATDPQPFTKMPLIYERSFGGIDYETGHFCRKNLVGQGFLGKTTKKTVDKKPLPNIEDSRNTITSPKDHPTPMGFGFYDRTWEPRVSHLGTYDKKWREHQSPKPPVDFNYAYHNAAHPDLQLDGYLAGDEAIELMNLSREHPKLNFDLPGVGIDCRARKSYEALDANLVARQADSEDIKAIRSLTPKEEPVRLNLDTLCIVPDDNTFFMLWRGTIPVYDLTALEISEIVVTKTAHRKTAVTDFTPSDMGTYGGPFALASYQELGS